MDTRDSITILTLEETLSHTIEELAALRLRGIYPAMAGAEEPPPESGASDEGEPDGGGEGDAGAGAGAGAPSGEGESDDDDEDDLLEISRGDYNRLRQISRQHEAAEKKRVKEERERKEREQREQGRYEEMLREKDEEKTSIESERDMARMELYNHLRDQRVEKVAKLLGFKDPEDALRFITDEDAEDEASAERALRKVAKRKPYLVDQKRSTGVAVGNDGKSILTFDQVKSMSEDEINENWDAVQAAMAAGTE